MRRLFCLLITSVICIFSLSSCQIASNYISTEYFHTIESSGFSYFKSNYSDNTRSDIYKLDFQNKTFSYVPNGFFDSSLFTVENCLKYAMFAGEYIDSVIPRGYEAVGRHIEACALDNEDSVVDACGYVNGKDLLGFVRVYKDTSGPYGNYAIEEISHSLIFSYNAEKDAFTVLWRLDGVVIVAQHLDTVIYWRDEAYYSYDLKSQKETYLIEDPAYDDGLMQHSYSYVFFNEKMCIFHLIKGGDTEYMNVYNFENNDFFELSYK